MERTDNKRACIVLTDAFRRWEWYDDRNVKVLFVHLLLLARVEDGTFRGREVHRGTAAAARTRTSERP